MQTFWDKCLALDEINKGYFESKPMGNQKQKLYLFWNLIVISNFLGKYIFVNVANFAKILGPTDGEEFIVIFHCI